MIGQQSHLHWSSITRWPSLQIVVTSRLTDLSFLQISTIKLKFPSDRDGELLTAFGLGERPYSEGGFLKVLILVISGYAARDARKFEFDVEMVQKSFSKKRRAEAFGIAWRTAGVNAVEGLCIICDYWYKENEKKVKRKSKEMKRKWKRGTGRRALSQSLWGSWDQSEPWHEKRSNQILFVRKRRG